jgi:LacI family transcriptional regulator
VGIIISYHTNPYIIDLVDSLEQALAAEGVTIYLCNCGMSSDSEKKYVEELLHRNVDALFVIESLNMNKDHAYLAEYSFGCPVILINQHIIPCGDNYIVRCDQEPGIREVFDHIKKHRLFPFALFIPGEDTYFHSYFLKEDLFKKWRRKNRISARDARLLKIPDIAIANEEECVWTACETAKKFLGATKPGSSAPRFILAGNDLMATGVLIAARELGIKVPKDLGIVGVDNTYLSRISMPALSTIDLRMRDVGTMAAELYLNLKNNADVPRVQTIPSRFIARGTS